MSRAKQHSPHVESPTSLALSGGSRLAAAMKDNSRMDISASSLKLYMLKSRFDTNFVSSLRNWPTKATKSTSSTYPIHC